MSIREDIALDIKGILGSNYYFYIDDNNRNFINIEKEMTVEKQMQEFRDKITVVFKTSIGEIVSLKDINAVSFSYSLDFYVPNGMDAYEGIERLIVEKNGIVVDNSEYRYVMTFNEPFLSPSNLDIRNGIFADVVTLTGNIAYSNKSLFGNDFKFYLDGQEIPGIISHTITGKREFEIKVKLGNALPKHVNKVITNVITLVIHGIKLNSVINNLLDYNIRPEQYIDRKFRLKVVRLEYTQEFDAEIIEVTEESTTNGYVIITVTFAKVAI